MEVPEDTSLQQRGTRWSGISDCMGSVSGFVVEPHAAN